MSKRIYTEDEVNADLAKCFDSREIHPGARLIFVELGKLGLLDAYIEVLGEMSPDDFKGDLIQCFNQVVREARRRVSA